MQTVKKFMYTLGVLVFVGLLLYVLGNYWGYIFSKTVDGQVYQIERITQPTMLVTQGILGKPNSPGSVTPAEAMYSFAVAIRSSDGKIYTASSEDRQWAVAQKGICVEAKFYPYPPWDLDSAGTYRNARLIAMKECPKDVLPVPSTNTPSPGASTGSEGSQEIQAPPGEQSPAGSGQESKN